MKRIPNEEIWEIITRSLVDDIGKEEKAVLDEWIQKNPENFSFYEYLRKVHLNPVMPQDLDHIKKKIWLRLKENTNVLNFTLTGTIIKRYKIYAIAASILLLFSLGLLLYNYFNTTQWITSASVPSKSELVCLNLSDHSKVWLESGSQIIYPQKFRSGKREVFLTGQAFFDIKPGRRPFIVHTGSIDIKVHGTRFSVIAFPDDAETKITLLSGSVSIVTKDKEPVFLKPGEQGTFNRENNTYLITPVDTEPFEAWKEGILFFRAMRFDEIAASLERVHHVRIIFRNEDLKREVFTGKFNRTEPVEEVLNVIRISTPFHYKIMNKTIEIYH